MKKLLLSFSVFLVASFVIAQDTFSIVAVDATTGEVGSAGASCIDNSGCGGCGGVIIISNLVPGRGAINAQATVCIPNSNLNNGIGWMLNGHSPTEILDSLLANDACVFGDTSTRQYGIVDIDSLGNPRSKAFTGLGAMNAKYHIEGPNYSIQGNILLDSTILNPMEAAFLSAEGDLACRLMAALQGANVPGADSRCLAEGTSSQSAFIRVAQPGDTTGTFSLNLNVSETPFGVEPIDSLQSLFDAVTSCPPLSLNETEQLRFNVRVYPNPNEGNCTVEMYSDGTGLEWKLADVNGKVIMSETSATFSGYKKQELQMQNLSAGTYFLEVKVGNNSITKRIIHQ